MILPLLSLSKTFYNHHFLDSLVYYYNDPCPPVVASSLGPRYDGILIENVVEVILSTIGVEVDSPKEVS